MRCRRARRARWSRSTPAECPKRCSRASSSATCAARSPTRAPIASAASSSPTAEPSFSTKSPTCRSSQQAKLLRVIAAGEFERLGSSRTRRVDVRILSATNADIDAEVAAGRFRQDLLFRLNTIEIALPPLRDRRDDIPSLATHFLEQHARRYRKRLTASTAPRWTRCCAIRGRATCASSSTRSSAAC